MTKYQVLKNFQVGGKDNRAFYKEGDVFIGDPSDIITKELLSEKRIQELSIIMNKNAADLKVKSDEAEKKAKVAKAKAEEFSSEKYPKDKNIKSKF